MLAAAVVIGIFGLAVGSFLNVCIARLPEGKSLWWPGSACPHCGAAIGWRDNVPLLSYALLRGRCRSCRSPIGLVYPAVELATALLVAGCILAFGVSLRALVAAVFCAALVVVTATDLEHRIIPNWIVGPSYLVTFGVLYLLRVDAEERMMREEFGAEYEAYMARTKRLIPGVY